MSAPGGVWASILVSILQNMLSQGQVPASASPAQADERLSTQTYTNRAHSHTMRMAGHLPTRTWHLPICALHHPACAWHLPAQTRTNDAPSHTNPRAAGAGGPQHQVPLPEPKHHGRRYGHTPWGVGRPRRAGAQGHQPVCKACGVCTVGLCARPLVSGCRWVHDPLAGA